MKHLPLILLAAILCATASAQTIRTLGYNSSNGVIVAATNVVWTNSFNFSTNTVAAQVRTNLALGASNDVVFSSVVVGDSGAAQPKLQGGTGFVGFYDLIDSEYVLKISSDTDPVEINGQWNDAGVRSSLGLPWSGLTNTNASDFQSALFSATNSAPINTTNAAGWVDLKVGTNSYKLPVYQ